MLAFPSTCDDRPATSRGGKTGMSHNTIRMTLVCFALASLLLVPSHAAGGGDSGIVWMDDYKAALSRAREENRPVMVEFWTSWCLYCGKLEKQTLGDPRVVELAKEFVCARIDADVQKAAAARYEPPGYPTVVFATPSGAEIVKISGFREADAFVTVMKAVHERGMELSEHMATLEDEPRDFAARVAVGEIFLDLGLADKASVHLKAAAKSKNLAPADEARVQFLLCKAAVADDNYRQAIKMLQKLINADPSGSETSQYYLELARAYAASGKDDKAEEVYGQLARLFPGSPEAQIASNRRQ
jgi:thioredoxin-like negative regulator of GroEL